MRQVHPIERFRSDEALWRSRLHYDRPTATLTLPRSAELLTHIRAVMTAALDVGHQQHVLELIDELRAEHDLTVVSALHDLTLAGQFSDRLVILAGGSVVAEGTAGEVLTIGGLEIPTCPLNHPDGATGYRFDVNDASAAVLTDMEHEGDASDPQSASLVAFSEGADVIVYDATFDEDDYPRYRGWGHSTWTEGVRLCQAAGVERLIAFHHDPDHDDAFLDRIDQQLRRALPGSQVAKEGLVLHP